MRIALLLLALALLALATYAATRGWGIAPEAEMGVHGLIALLLGVGFSLAIAVLLVGLMLYSRRRDFDQ